MEVRWEAEVGKAFSLPQQNGPLVWQRRWRNKKWSQSVASKGHWTQKWFPTAVLWLEYHTGQSNQGNIITVEVVDHIEVTEGQVESHHCLYKTHSESINVCANNDSITEFSRHENDIKCCRWQYTDHMPWLRADIVHILQMWLISTPEWHMHKMLYLSLHTGNSPRCLGWETK